MLVGSKPGPNRYLDEPLDLTTELSRGWVMLESFSMYEWFICLKGGGFDTHHLRLSFCEDTKNN